MEERDNDEEGRIFTQLSGSPGLSMSLLPTKEERTYDVDGWLAAWKVSGFMSMERIRADGSGEDKLLPSGPASLPDEQVPISHNDDNVYWKELLMLVYVWVAFLIVQIVKVSYFTLYSTQDKIHSIVFVSQKILSRNPWQGKITEEVWIQNSLIIGFDPKSSTAISKCMVMGAAGSTVYFNLRLRHPTLDMPLYKL
ncbi:unnamed protein product [Prunus brigantina]